MLLRVIQGTAFAGLLLVGAVVGLTLAARPAGDATAVVTPDAPGGEPAPAPAAVVETPAPAPAPTPERPSAPQPLLDAWFGIYVDEVKTGWTHVRATPRPGAGGGIELVERHFVRRSDAVKRTLQQTEMTLRILMEDDLAVREATLETIERGERDRVTTRALRREGERFVVRTELDGKVQEEQLEAPMPVVGSNDLLVMRLAEEGKLGQPGFEHTFHELDFHPPRAVEKKLRVVGSKPHPRAGREATLTGVSFDTVRLWVDERGLVDHGVAGGTVFRREPEAMARRFDRGQVYTYQNKWRSPVPIPGLPGADAVIVRFTVPRDDRGDVFVSNDYQEVLAVEEEGEDRIYRVKLLSTASGAPDGEEALGGEHPAAMAEFLASDPIRCSDDEVVAAKAREIAGGAKTTREAVTKLADWIHRTLRKRYTAIGNLTARETLDGGAGDCSEHAILFDAFARSLGIPVRECGGFVFWNEQGGAHAWSQAWIDGEWVHVDCVGNLIGAPPQYVMFRRHEAGRPRDPELAGRMTLLQTRSVEVDVESVERGGESWTLEQLRQSARVKDGRYESDLIGLTFDLPDGWSVLQVDGPFTIRLRHPSGANVRLFLRTDAPVAMIRSCLRSLENLPGPLRQKPLMGPPRAWTGEASTGGDSAAKLAVVHLDRGSLLVNVQWRNAESKKAATALLEQLQLPAGRPFGSFGVPGGGPPR